MFHQRDAWCLSSVSWRLRVSFSCSRVHVLDAGPGMVGLHALTTGISVPLDSGCWGAFIRSTDLWHVLGGKDGKLSFVLNPIRENTRDGKFMCVLLTSSSNILVQLHHLGEATGTRTELAACGADGWIWKKGEWHLVGAFLGWMRERCPELHLSLGDPNTGLLTGQ